MSGIIFSRRLLLASMLPSSASQASSMSFLRRPLSLARLFTSLALRKDLFHCAATVPAYWL